MNDIHTYTLHTPQHIPTFIPYCGTHIGSHMRKVFVHQMGNNGSAFNEVSDNQGEHFVMALFVSHIVLYYVMYVMRTKHIL